jgi:hypothetical protein
MNKDMPGFCGDCGGELDSEGWCANYCEEGSLELETRLDLLLNETIDEETA